MAWLFLDTSALARRYLRGESNAARVAALCRPSRGHTLAIAHVTPAEVASALARARRNGRIDEHSLRRGWALFVRRREQRRYLIVDLERPVVDHAAELTFRHPLRAYDAVQIASALHLRSRLGPATPFRFVTSDQNQATAAGAEGLDVDFVP